MNVTCLQFWRLLRRVIRREPDAWPDLNRHMNQCPICKDWEKQPAPVYEEPPGDDLTF